MFKLIEIKNVFENVDFVNWSDDVVVNLVEHDTRRISSGALYVAIKGANLDGHQFVKEAIKKGAVACIVKHRFEDDIKIPQIVVKDTIKAYGELARYWRKKIKYPIIAVTGSNGKTTTKELLKAIMTSKYKTVCNSGNLNNLIGLPFSLLSFPLDAGCGILELGMNNLGEISELAKICMPDIGVITNIGRAHIGMLGSVDNILKAKLELFDYINFAKGTIFVNLSDAVLGTWWENNKSDCKCKTFVFAHDDYSKIISKHYGNIHPDNISAAISIAQSFGVKIETCIEAIKSFSMPLLRSNLIHKNGITFFMDCYNANPDSMNFSLYEAVKIKNNKKYIAVLGDMLELGEDSEYLHIETGSLAADAGFDALFVIGDYSRYYAEGFLNISSQKKNIYVYNKDEIDNLISDLYDFIKKGDLVLVKGSRGMKLERIIKG